MTRRRQYKTLVLQSALLVCQQILFPRHRFVFCESPPTAYKTVVGRFSLLICQRICTPRHMVLFRDRSPTAYKNSIYGSLRCSDFANRFCFVTTGSCFPTRRRQCIGQQPRDGLNLNTEVLIEPLSLMTDLRHMLSSFGRHILSIIELCMENISDTITFIV